HLNHFVHGARLATYIEREGHMRADVRARIVLRHSLQGRKPCFAPRFAKPEGRLPAKFLTLIRTYESLERAVGGFICMQRNRGERTITHAALVMPAFLKVLAMNKFPQHCHAVRRLHAA